MNITGSSKLVRQHTVHINDTQPVLFVRRKIETRKKKKKGEKSLI